jgi:hypothetical protein
LTAHLRSRPTRSYPEDLKEETRIEILLKM